LRNPFDVSQYSLNFTSGEIFDPVSGGMLGIDYIMKHIQDAILLRQRAVSDAYSRTIPFNPVDVSGLIFDTPSSIYTASEILNSAMMQFLAGHPSGEYERIILSGCSADAIEPNGFFQKVTYNTGKYDPTDGYYLNINQLVGDNVSTSDLTTIAIPPVFGSDATPSMLSYARAQGAWANSFLKILNKLSYIHKSLSVNIPNVNCAGENDACTFNYALNGNEVDQMWADNPVEVIIDVENALTCSSISEFGYLCLSFSSLVGKHRVVVLPTIDRLSADNTSILRSKLFGFSEIGQDGIPYGGGSPVNPYGYLNPSVYTNISSQVVRMDVNGVGVECPVNPIADSSCINTATQFPPSPWKKQNNVAKLCIPVNYNMFSTSSDPDDGWRYKIRLIIFPNCSIGATSMSWSVALNCMDCSCDDVFCGGDDPPPPPGPSRSICAFSQTRAGSGPITVHDYVLSINNALQCPPGSSTGRVCLRFKTNQGSVAPDRLYVLRTWYPPEHDVDSGFTSVSQMINAVRSPVFGANAVDMSGFDSHLRSNTGYYSNVFYVNEALTNRFGNDGLSSFNPYFSSSSDVGVQINCPVSALIVDSGCVHSRLPEDFVPFDAAFSPVEWCYDEGTGSFITCFNIPSDSYSNDVNDPWHKKLRVIVFDDCSNFGTAVWSASSQCIGCSCSLCPCDEYPSSSSSSSSSFKSSSSSSAPSSSSSSKGVSSSSSSSSSSLFVNPCAGIPNCGLGSCDEIPPGQEVDITAYCQICFGYTCPNPIFMSAIDFCTLQLDFGCTEVITSTCCSGGVPVTINQIVRSGGFDCECNIVSQACEENCNNQCIGFGSMVLIADGSSKKVESIVPGDELLSVDFGIDPDFINVFDKDSVPADTSGWKYCTTRVTSVSFGFERQYYLVNNKLRLTYEHPILAFNENKIFFRSVSMMHGTERCYNEKLEEMHLDIRKIDKALATVKINTERSDWFFVDGILVHNAEINGENGANASDPQNNNQQQQLDGGPDPFSSSSSSKILIP